MKRVHLGGTFHTEHGPCGMWSRWYLGGDAWLGRLQVRLAPWHSEQDALWADARSPAFEGWGVEGMTRARRSGASGLRLSARGDALGALFLDDCAWRW